MSEPITQEEHHALDRVVRLAEITLKVWDLTDVAKREVKIARSVVDRIGDEHGQTGPA